jgi:hypothetical protein
MLNGLFLFGSLPLVATLLLNGPCRPLLAASTTGAQLDRCEKNEHAESAGLTYDLYVQCLVMERLMRAGSEMMLLFISLSF